MNSAPDGKTHFIFKSHVGILPLWLFLPMEKLVLRSKVSSFCRKASLLKRQGADPQGVHLLCPSLGSQRMKSRSPIQMQRIGALDVRSRRNQKCNLQSNFGKLIISQDLTLMTPAYSLDPQQPAMSRCIKSCSRQPSIRCGGRKKRRKKRMESQMVSLFQDQTYAIAQHFGNKLLMNLLA